MLTEDIPKGERKAATVVIMRAYLFTEALSAFMRGNIIFSFNKYSRNAGPHPPLGRPSVSFLTFGTQAFGPVRYCPGRGTPPEFKDSFLRPIAPLCYSQRIESARVALSGMSRSA